MKTIKTALGLDASAEGVGATAIGALAKATEAGTVSFGSGDSVDPTRRLVNVAAGKRNTDAVNVGQLKTAMKRQANEIYELKRQLQALAHQT
ncbi:hypothetical protein LN050_08550 [Comamonadaceae bacterium M7527]|nr:hypothetical protein LN050_08550 [Comamonadaceae bacterium M7527]